MQNIIAFICRSIERVSSILIQFAKWGIFAMMLIIVTDVALRSLCGVSLLIAEEMGGYLLVLTSYLAMAETLKRGKHLRVEIIWQRLPHRLQTRFDLITSFLGLAALIVVTWRSIIMVYRSYVRGSLVPGALLTPVYIPQLVLLIGILGLLLQYFVEIHKMLKDNGVSNHEPEIETNRVESHS